MSSKLSLGVVATVVLMLSVGAAGAIWATASGGNSSVGDTARLVPADTAFYATVNTDPASRQWLQFGQILARLGVAGQLRDLRDQGSLLADLQWDDDIAPYLGGEATVAFGGLDGDRPDALVILATADGGRAWDHAVRLLDHRAQQRGVPPESRSYRGTTIRTYEEDGPARQLWIARKDRYLMIGTAPSGADAVLDVAAGRGATLAGLDRFRAARAAVTDDSLLFAYMNPAALGDLAGTLGSSLVPGATTETLAAAGWENAAVALAISAERTGLRFEWQTVGLDTSRNPIALRSAPETSRFAARAPADSLLFVAGADLYGSMIRGALESARRIAGGEDFVDAMRREVGFDVERDLLAQLTGEYALAAGSDTLDADDLWVLGMSGVQDAAVVTRALGQLDDYGRREGRRVTSSRVGSATIVESRGSGSADSYAYTIVGDELIAGNGAAFVRGALTQAAPLSGNADYKESLTIVPAGRSLTTFVNLAQLIRMARSSDVLLELPIDLQALDRLRYLAVALTQSDDRAGGVAFLRISGE